MPDLRADYYFSIYFPIELKIKNNLQSVHVLNQFACFEVYMKETFLSYLVISVFCCQFPPLLSYNCFYASRLIVRNRYPQATTGWTSTVRPHLDIIILDKSV